MTETEFLKHQGDYFYLRTMKYVVMYTAEDELQNIRENNLVLFLTFEQGRFSIKYNELAEKAELDLTEFKRENPEIEFDA